MTAAVHIVHLADEIPDIGSGVRTIIAIEGRKWVRVMCPYTLTHRRIDKAVYGQLLRNARPGDKSVTVKKIAKRLRETRLHFTKLGLYDGGNAVDEFLTALKEATPKPTKGELA